MKPKNPGTHSLEDPATTRDPSTPVVAEAPSREGQLGGPGDENTDAHPPGEAVLQRAAEPSPRGGVAKQDPEYEEVDDLDLIYERTGTLCFPYPSRKVESGVRATDPALARPEVTRAPSVWSELSAVFPLGRRLRDARAASAGSPGVSMRASVDAAAGEAASTPQRREPSTPPAVTRAQANAASPTRTSRALVASRALPQQVAVGPAFPPARRHSVVAHRALTKVNHTDVAPTSRHSSTSRGREARSPAQVSSGKRTTQTSRPTRQPALRTYPTFGQRVRAELRRVRLAKWSAALGVLAALVVASVFVVSSAFVPKRGSRERAAPRASVAAAVDQRAPVPAPAHLGPRVSVVAAEPPPEAPKRLGRPAPDALPTGARSTGAKATARSNRRTTTHSSPPEPCDCFPGDPLCGCLD